MLNLSTNAIFISTDGTSTELAKYSLCWLNWAMYRHGHFKIQIVVSKNSPVIYIFVGLSLHFNVIGIYLYISRNM